MNLKTITARQCKQARGLLKWNLYDLSSRTNIPPKHLERFERNLSRLNLPENLEVKEVYEKNGIVFCDNLDVIFVAKQDGADALSMVIDANIANEEVKIEDYDLVPKKKKDETEDEEKRKQHP